MISFSVPNYFYLQKTFNVLKLDQYSAIRYSQKSNTIKMPVNVTENLLVVVLSGKKILHTKFSDYTVNQGEAIIIKSGCYLMSEFVTKLDQPYQSIIFSFNDDFVNNFLERENQVLDNIELKNKSMNFIFKIDISPLFKSIIESIIPFFVYDSKSSEKILKYKLFELFLSISDSDIKDDFINFLQNIYQNKNNDISYFMQKNYLRQLSLKEMAFLNNKSLSSFKNDFKDKFNDSPKTWINNKRLEQAKILLETTDKNITEICFDTGFENISYFIKCFKDKYNETPKQFQKKQKVLKF